MNVTTDTGDHYSQHDEIERRLRAETDRTDLLENHRQSDNVHIRPPMRKAHSASFNSPSKATPSVASTYEQSTGLITGNVPRAAKQKSLQETFSKALGRRKREEKFIKSSEFSLMESHMFHIGEDPCERDHNKARCLSSSPECVDDLSGLGGTVSSVSSVTGVRGEASGGGEQFRSLLLFIPLRLGQETFNMEYARPLMVSRITPMSCD